MVKNLFLTIGLLVLFSLHSQSAQRNGSFSRGKQLVMEMCAVVDSINTLEVLMRKQERVNDKMGDQTSYFKLQMNPLNVYIYQEYPKKGLEILYREGQNDQKLLVYPGGFPWINVNLNWNSKLARDGQHHTIHDAGLKVVCDIVKRLIKKYDRLSDTLVYAGDTINFVGKSDTVKTIQIHLNNPFYNIETTEVKEGEDLTSIARKKYLCPYKLLELNQHKVDYYDEVKVGDVIFLPNDYAKKMTITLELDRMIPRKIEVWDEKGLFEVYEYITIDIHTPLSSIDFSPENKEYGF